MREVRWGELQENVEPVRQRAARARRRAGRPRRDAAAADARDRGGVLRHLQAAGRSCSRCRCSTATTASATASTDSEAKVLVTDAANQHRVDPSLVEHVLLLDDELLATRRAGLRRRRHGRRRPGAALLLLRHDRARQGHRARAPLPARPRGVRLLPRRPGRRALPRHGRVGVGGRDRAAARARGGSAPSSSSTSARAASTRTSSSTSSSRHEVTNVFTTPTAMRSMMSIADAGQRYPQKFRIVCSAGEPLNPEAIRWFREQYGVTVLDYYGLTESYPLVANYPFMEVREGSMGKPMPGWDVAILDEDEQAASPQGERGEICLRARSNPHYPLGLLAQRRRTSEETFGGEWFHTKDAASARRGRLRLVRGPRRRRDHRRRLPDRPVRGRVRLPRAPGGGRGGGGRLPGRAPRQRRQGVHRARRGARGLRRARQGDQGATSATGCRPTPTRARSSSSTSCPRR